MMSRKARRRKEKSLVTRRVRRVKRVTMTTSLLPITNLLQSSPRRKTERDATRKLTLCATSLALNG